MIKKKASKGCWNDFNVFYPWKKNVSVTGQTNVYRISGEREEWTNLRYRQNFGVNRVAVSENTVNCAPLQISYRLWGSVEVAGTILDGASGKYNGSSESFLYVLLSFTSIFQSVIEMSCVNWMTNGSQPRTFFSCSIIEGHSDKYYTDLQIIVHCVIISFYNG